jgi:hypothetical protein
MSVFTIVSIPWTEVVVVTVFAVGALAVGIPLGIWGLAHFDGFFSFPIEGKEKIVVRGKRPVKVIGSLIGYRRLKTEQAVEEYNQRKRLKGCRARRLWSLVPLERGDAPEKVKGVFGRLCKWLNIEWIGCWPFCTIHRYHLKARMVTINADGSLDVKIINGWTNFVYSSEVFYVSSVIGPTIKTQAIQVKLDFMFKLPCRDAIWAVFGQGDGDWYKNVSLILNTEAEQFLAVTGWEELNVNPDPKNNAQNDAFHQWMKAIEPRIGEMGFELSMEAIREKSPYDDEAREFVNAIAMEKTAERKGLAKVEEAKQLAAARKHQGEGEGDYLGRVFEGQKTALDTSLAAVSNNVGGIADKLDGKGFSSVLAAATTALVVALSQLAVVKKSSGGPQQPGQGGQS